MTVLTYVRTKGQLVAWLIAGGIVTTYFMCESCTQSMSRYALVAIYISLMWIAMWLGNEFISHALDERIPWTKQPIKRLVVGIAVVVAYSFSVAYALAKIFERFFDVTAGGTMHLYVTVIITVVITLVMTSRSFLFNWRQSAIDAEKLQKENITARYQSLKDQVNPHFLFNSFNALSNLVYEDPDKAVKFIKQLSEVYRYVLDTRDQEVVTVEKELKFLESYIYLQQIRFGNKLKIEVSISRTGSYVTPLALQMLVENAIKHNVVAEDEPLTIRLYEDDGYIAVENNLQKKKVIVEPSAGVGLENICKRYELLSDKKVQIRENETSFVVKIPELDSLGYENIDR
jgi:hypothetical protein